MVSTQKLNLFTKEITEWYAHNKRDLPWRETTDPYFIWLSEIILQQTRVEQGLPYYQAFTSTYPTVQELANAPQDDVLRLWQGLGYYSRARNLHKAAQQVVNESNGQFPKTYEGLLSLTGIGPYTAAAISSFAFNVPKSVVDGNVFRVYARFYGLEHDIAEQKNRKYFEEIGDRNIQLTEPALYNQSIMEFGAIQCKPVNPDCEACPLQSSCWALKHAAVDKLPIKSKKIKIKHRYLHYYFLEHKGMFYFEQRGPKDIWEGLYQPYLIEQEEVPSLPFEFNSSKELALGVKHQLSHQKLHANFKMIRLSTIPEELQSKKWYTLSEIEELPKPILVAKIVKQLAH
jgi:A/G-specific adenine glycosylase